MTFADLLHARGLGPAALADQIIAAGYCDPTERDNLVRNIRRWRTGEHQPDPRYRSILHDVLGPAVLAVLHDPYPALAPLDLDVVALATRIARSDVTTSTIDDLRIAVEDLCSRYSTDPPRLLLRDAGRWLIALRSALAGHPGLDQARQLKESAAWLTLLTACLRNDIGDRTSADTLRRITADLADDIGHGEVAAWSHELAVWFNLCDGRPEAAIAAAQRGQVVAPAGATVLIQLAGQEAMAWARLRRFDDAAACLDRAQGYVDRIPFPANPRNHFAIDSGKARKAEMWTAVDMGDLERAERAARYVLDEGRLPDGSHRMPMREAEGWTALAVVAARRGDVAGAVRLADRALAVERVSVPSLAGDVCRVAAALPEGDERDGLDARLRLVTTPAAA